MKCSIHDFIGSTCDICRDCALMDMDLERALQHLCMATDEGVVGDDVG